MISSDFANQKQTKIFHETHGPGGFACNGLKNEEFSSSMGISKNDYELNNVYKNNINENPFDPSKKKLKRNNYN